jgi:NCS1 family nucleobase:cation symporter-1
MDRIREFHDHHLVLSPEPGSFTAEAESARWSNRDLTPVKPERKKWEWYHVGGFWIAEGFSAAQMESVSSAVALGLNPGIAMVACLVGNIMVTVPVCIMGYVGAKVSGVSASTTSGDSTDGLNVQYSINFPVIARA